MDMDSLPLRYNYCKRPVSGSQEDLKERTFKFRWIIHDWKKVIQEDKLYEKTYEYFDLQNDGLIFAKIMVGISLDQIDSVGFYMRLLDKHHCLDNVDTYLVMEVLQRGGNVGRTITVEANAQVGTKIDLEKSFWECSNPDSSYYTWTTCEGTLIITFKFTLRNLPNLFSIKKREAFRVDCVDSLSRDMEALLMDKINYDVKFLTKDKTEVLAHRNILRARCPVFVPMFGPEFSESGSGVINVPDISDKTMKILVNYWYTGKLLDSWEDADTVVEFVYAAGKYQMTRVLKVLDETLGFGDYSFHVELELLKITGQLPLKIAQKTIVKELTSKITYLYSISLTKLLKFLCLENYKIDEEFISVAQMIKACNSALCENDDENASSEHLKCLILACEFGMKDIEKNLLARITRTVNKIDNAEEFLALFDLQNRENSCMNICQDSDDQDDVKVAKHE